MPLLLDATLTHTQLYNQTWKSSLFLCASQYKLSINMSQRLKTLLLFIVEQLHVLSCHHWWISTDTKCTHFKSQAELSSGSCLLPGRHSLHALHDLIYRCLVTFLSQTVTLTTLVWTDLIWWDSWTDEDKCNEQASADSCMLFLHLPLCFCPLCIEVDVWKGNSQCCRTSVFLHAAH